MTDTWLTVWESDGMTYTVEIQEEPRIDVAVSQFIESGGTRDSLLHLNMTDGRCYVVRASVITSWAISTPDTRRKSMKYQQWQKEETKRFMQELGVVSWDGEE